MHGLELYRACRLLVDQVVMERRVRSLVSQEVVRQLDLDLLWTHNDHFVEKTNRNLQEFCHTCNEFSNCDFKEQDGAEDGFPALGEIKDQPGGDRPHVKIIVQSDTVHKANHLNEIIFCKAKQVSCVIVCESLDVLSIPIVRQPACRSLCICGMRKKNSPDFAISKSRSRARKKGVGRSGLDWLLSKWRNLPRACKAA